MITIDETKCVRCLKCTAVCPSKYLRAIDGIPQPKQNKRCMGCLHCAAACPQSAVLWNGKPGSLPFPKNANGSGDGFALPEDFTDSLSTFLMSRRSYRRFTGEPLAEPLILEALSLSDFAPSAKNQHPAHFLVINDGEKVQIIMNHILNYVKETGVSPEIVTQYEAGSNIVTGTAVTLILAWADKTAINAPVDCALALSTAELFFQSRGLGTCWGGYLTRMSNAVPALKELYALPEDAQFYGTLMVGYPKDEQYPAIPARVRRGEVRFL